MGESSVFITGATGFLGRAVLQELQRTGNRRVVCLVRSRHMQPSENAFAVHGDLLDSKSYSTHMQGCDSVLHMAALTGKAAPSEYFRVNSQGTEVLAREAVHGGVRKVIFLSSIAAKFEDLDYHYGRSKREAEQKVKDAGMGWAIVRPTMIFGKGSPVQQSLTKLALLPAIPIFGDGKVRVQPVFVGDLAKFLVRMLDDDNFNLRTIEVGGPETVTMENLIQMIRQIRKGSRGPALRLPIGPISGLLRITEPILRPVLPFTAGQLASFRHDGTADPDPLIATNYPQMKRLKDMIDDAA